MAKVMFSDIDDHEGYIIEVSLPPQFSDEISESLAESSLEMSTKLGEDNIYITIGESRTFDILEDLNLDPFKPELPALLLLDKHPKDVKKEDRLILIKLGALEQAKEVPIVLDELCRLVNTEGFMSDLSSNQKRRRLVEAFKDLSNVGVSLVSTGLGK